MISGLRAAATLAALVLLTGCATAAPQASERANPRLITSDQIRANHATDAFDLIRGLRPSWLQRRGQQSLFLDGEVVVYLDHVRIGGPGALRSVQLSDVERVEFFDAASATQRWGTGHAHGGIRVIPRGGGEAAAR